MKKLILILLVICSVTFINNQAAYSQEDQKLSKGIVFEVNSNGNMKGVSVGIEEELNDFNIRGEVKMVLGKGSVLGLNISALKQYKEVYILAGVGVYSSIDKNFNEYKSYGTRIGLEKNLKFLRNQEFRGGLYLRFKEDIALQAQVRF